MAIPTNEGRVCDAVVKHLEKRTGETRADIRHPEKDLDGPPVDLRLTLDTQEYAIEHTRIEPFENQIKTGVVFKQINDYIKERVSGSLPGTAYYQLQVPIDVCLPGTRKKHDKVLNNLVEWIRITAQWLHERNLSRSGLTRSPFWADDSIQGTPKGFNCAIELLRWPDATLIRRKPGCLDMRSFYPDGELENLRIDRLRRAFSDKCPKLEHCKQEGARTVLVLENRDLALTSFDLIGNQLPALLAERTDAPDEIYLVETGWDLWWVYLMKLNNNHWPTVGMPQWGQAIYEPDKLPTQGMPEWYRDALALDELYKPHPLEWIPATFEIDELVDLTCSSEPDTNCPRYPT